MLDTPNVLGLQNTPCSWDSELSSWDYGFPSFGPPEGKPLDSPLVFTEFDGKCHYVISIAFQVWHSLKLNRCTNVRTRQLLRILFESWCQFIVDGEVSARPPDLHDDCEYSDFDQPPVRQPEVSEVFDFSESLQILNHFPELEARLGESLSLVRRLATQGDIDLGSDLDIISDFLSQHHAGVG